MLDIISDAKAAALGHKFNFNKGVNTVLVFDLGGSSNTVSILKKDEKNDL